MVACEVENIDPRDFEALLHLSSGAPPQPEADYGRRPA